MKKPYMLTCLNMIQTHQVSNDVDPQSRAGAQNHLGFTIDEDILESLGL